MFFCPSNGVSFCFAGPVGSIAAVGAGIISPVAGVGEDDVNESFLHRIGGCIVAKAVGSDVGLTVDTAIGFMSGCVDGCMDGCVDGCMDGCMDGCIEGSAVFST
jgi:hypothetical protein